VIHNQYLLLLSMVGVGIAWASILSMPYAILSTALPANRMGVYMGVFNFFIVIPEIVASLGFGPLTRFLFGQNNPNAPLYTVMLGGLSLITAAVCVTFVRDGDGGVPVGAVITGDSRELLGVQESLQPVPGSGP
jgi:maltose/moltooligosaccharide transporter